MIYRPRMLAKLLVPLDIGRTTENAIAFELRPRSATLDLHDHNHAAQLDLECAWSDLGIDPRFARSASVEFHMGNADDFGGFTASDATFRFAGVADIIEREAKDGSGHVARVKCRDFTALFLGMRPFPTDGVPRMSEGLQDAWARICDHVGYRDPESGEIVSSVAALRNRIEFRGNVDPSRPIGDAVSSRFSRIGGPIAVKQGADAWAVWQRCVGMMGLISFIDRDRCVVTTSTDLFADDPLRAPKLVWGRNILEMTEQAPSARDTKGVGLTSFDPLTFSTIEAVYSPNKKRPRGRPAAHSRSAKKIVEADDVDWFEYHGVTDPDVLATIAQRVYEERSRQELEGHLVTAEMLGERVDGTTMDLLSLRVGDSIRVEIDPMDEGVFSRLETRTAREEYLTDRGYSANAARLLAANAGQLSKLGRTFKVAGARTKLSADGDAGEFQIEIRYFNRIQVA